MTTCLKDLEIKKFHIIIIQKSWFNLYFAIIYHFLKNNHTLIYSNLQKMKRNKIKVCLFITKNISLNNLNFVYRTEDLITTKILLHQTNDTNHYFYVYNVYNEFNILSCLTINHLKKTLNSESNSKKIAKHFIVKDFNIHHFI